MSRAILPQTPKTGFGSLGTKVVCGKTRNFQACPPTLGGFLQVDGWGGTPQYLNSIGPCHPKGRDGKKHKTTGWYFTEELSEQIRQDEARRFWFNAVDPEVGTAGVILVSSICQLEAVRF